MIQRNLVHLLNVAIREYRSLQASSPSKRSEPRENTRARGFATRSRILAKPVSLAQTGELTRRL